MIAAASRPAVIRTVSRWPRRLSVTTGAQPLTFSGALTFTTLPLWPVNVPVTFGRAPRQTSFLITSGIVAPPVKERSKRSSGTSGIPPNELCRTPSLPGSPTSPNSGSVTAPVRLSARPGSEFGCVTANVTGLVSAVGSSGDVAVALPIRDVAGHAFAENAASEQALDEPLQVDPDRRRQADVGDRRRGLAVRDEHGHAQRRRRARRGRAALADHGLDARRERQPGAVGRLVGRLDGRGRAVDALEHRAHGLRASSWRR